MPYQLPRSKEPRFKDFDVQGYMRQAAKLAREFHDDAKLVRLMAYYVAPNGRANLTLGQSGMAIYQFRSKKASVRGDTPKGVQLQCMVAVNVMPAVGVTVAPYGDDRCEEAIVGFPRCTPAQVWQKAIDRGAPTDAVATLMFGVFQGRAQWMFTISGEATFFIADDCD